MRITFVFLLALAGWLGLSVGPSYAQATRTWVSGVGDDANPCSRTAPCKTFAGAISKTAGSGEINALDPGGFGGVTITKSITLRSDHIQAGVLVSGTSGIIVNGAGINVVLDGLDIVGIGTGIHGVNILQAGVVQIKNCVIQRFTGNGINLTSSSPGTRITVTDSTISFNSGGIFVKGNGVANTANVNNVVLDTNSSFGLQADGSGNAVSIFRSTVLGSPAGVSILNGAVIASRGQSNVITGTMTGITSIPFN